MKTIKVYLQYPWKFPDSPYYKYLVENPPKGVEFLNAEKQKGVITDKKLFFCLNKLKKSIRSSLNFFGISFPNARLSPKGDYDLIHCAHCLSLNKDKPWIADFEGVWQFWVGKKTMKSKEKVRKLLLKENCKKIIPWTKTAANDIVKEFPEIKEKVEVVYPAIPLPKIKRRKHKKVTILYAARYFWLKGGIIALEVCRKLKEKYKDEIELILISDASDYMKEKYSELKIKDLVPQKKLFQLYSKADIFFYPSFMDTFGFAILEAMSFGLPIVSVNTKYTKTRKEIIKNEKNGLIFDIEDKLTDKILKSREKLVVQREEQKIIEKLVENCSVLIENKKLRKKMSRNGIEMIKKGKFSIKERNKKLKRIYEEALK